MVKGKILEIDGGNSSYKWRLLDKGSIATSGRFGLVNHGEGFLSLSADLEDCVQARVASVAGAQADSQLVKVLESVGIGSIRFAQVSRHCNGVRCGYEELSQLGVDRWLAVLAAAHEFDGALAVADFGTALTLDFIDFSANHIGGYIVPGWSLMCQALIEGTAIDVSRIPVDFETDDLAPGLSSADSIGRGRLLSMSVLVEEGVARFESRLGSQVKLVCTGGDALRVLPHLNTEAVFRPDLVLDGLALALT